MPVLPTAFSPATVSRVALANLVANGVIVVTGGAVRVTGSGLGCPTWPRCTDESFVVTPELAGHGVIEFGNRLLTFVLTAVAIATLVVVFRSVRRDRGRWRVLGFLGIPAQALLGGVTVLTGLNPWTVAAHFLVSRWCWWRWRRCCGCARGSRASVSPAAPSLRAAGPRHRRRHRRRPGARHGGHRQRAAQRRPEGRPTGFDPELVSQLHADVVFLLLGLTVALLVALYATDSPTGRRAARDLLIVQLAQGLVGYVQYFTDLPIVLVLLHMLGAVLITAFTARPPRLGRGPRSPTPSRHVPDDTRVRTGRPRPQVPSPWTRSPRRSPGTGCQDSTRPRRRDRSRPSRKVAADQTMASTTIATDSSARYEIETWNSCIGLVSPPPLDAAEQAVRLDDEPGAQARPRRSCRPRPMPCPAPTGQSSSETATVSQAQTADCRPTDSSLVTTGSIGTSARA